MTSRRDLITTVGASLLLAGIHPRGLAGESAAPCGPAECITCGPTGRATAGPFYVSNAPATMDINLLEAPGTRMDVTGLVLGGAKGRQPLAGARVELWHADGDGRYHPEDNGDIARFAPEEINLRGQVVADADGRFRFHSIVPGRYGNRRRHLHWRLVAEGHRPLVTQTYWLDEKGSRYERSDPVDRDAEDCRWIAFRTDGRTLAGEVVFVLEPTA